MRDVKFEYGFESVNGIVKKVYYLNEIPKIEQKCDVWNALPLKYVRQFTGLKDRNGVEIYENDIIKTTRGDWGVIIYKAPFFEVTVSENQSCTYSRQWFSEIEVIGNIYQNPELLQSKNS